MIIYVDEQAEPKQLETLKEWLNGIGVEVHSLKGENGTILGLLGETQNVDVEMIQSLDFVRKVVKVKEPYKSSNRQFHPNDTIIEIGEAKFGGGHFAAIAGPCSVESTEQICGIAKAVKEAGATMLRGGAFKPRTSPYSFQGLRSKGIELLLQAKQITGMSIVSEIMDIASMSQIQRTLLGDGFDFSVICQIAFFLGISVKDLTEPRLSQKQIQKEQEIKLKVFQKMEQV